MTIKMKTKQKQQKNAETNDTRHINSFSNKKKKKRIYGLLRKMGFLVSEKVLKVYSMLGIGNWQYTQGTPLLLLSKNKK